MRAFRTSLVSLAVAIGLAGCGSDGTPDAGSGPATPVAASAQPTTVAPTSASPTPAASQRPTTAYVVHWKASDGTAVTTTFNLAAGVRASDPAVAAWFPAGPPCKTDPQRDLVFVGTLTITNDTPDFSASAIVGLGVDGGAMGDATARFGAAFGNGPQCEDLNGADSMQTAMGAVQPNLRSGRWGPTPIELVIRGVYSPAKPAGDASVVADNSVSVLVRQESGSNFYKPEGLSGPVRKDILTSVRLTLAFTP